MEPKENITHRKLKAVARGQKDLIMHLQTDINDQTTDKQNLWRKTQRRKGGGQAAQKFVEIDREERTDQEINLGHKVHKSHKNEG